MTPAGAPNGVGYRAHRVTRSASAHGYDVLWWDERIGYVERRAAGGWRACAPDGALVARASTRSAAAAALSAWHRGGDRVRGVEGHTPRRTVRVSDDLWDAATARAAREGVTVSDVVRLALEAYTAP